MVAGGDECEKKRSEDRRPDKDGGPFIIDRLPAAASSATRWDKGAPSYRDTLGRDLGGGDGSGADQLRPYSLRIDRPSGLFLGRKIPYPRLGQDLGLASTGEGAGKQFHRPYSALWA